MQYVNLALCEIRTIFFSLYRQRLTKLGRTIGEVDCVEVVSPLRTISKPVAPHELDSFQRLQRSNQDCFRDTFLRSHDIRTEVHPVREVDIEMPSFPEHYLVATRAAVISVGSRIQSATIGLYFNDSPHERRSLVHSD